MTQPNETIAGDQPEASSTVAEPAGAAPSAPAAPEPAVDRANRSRPDAGSAAELTEDSIVRFRSDRPQHGWRAALYAITGGLLNPGVGAAERRRQDQLRRIRTKRPISFWYGARSPREILYRELFDELAEEHANFRWTVALSEPDPDWEGEVGFVHEVLQRRYLADHPSPERCEYYLCGPPVMASATRSMLATLGVPPENIYLDDFGA